MKYKGIKLRDVPKALLALQRAQRPCAIFRKGKGYLVVSMYTSGDPNPLVDELIADASVEWIGTYPRGVLRRTVYEDLGMAPTKGAYYDDSTVREAHRMWQGGMTCVAIAEALKVEDPATVRHWVTGKTRVKIAREFREAA